MTRFLDGSMRSGFNTVSAIWQITQTKTSKIKKKDGVHSKLVIISANNLLIFAGTNYFCSLLSKGFTITFRCVYFSYILCTVHSKLNFLLQYCS